MVQLRRYHQRVSADDLQNISRGVLFQRNPTRAFEQNDANTFHLRPIFLLLLCPRPGTGEKFLILVIRVL